IVDERSLNRVFCFFPDIVRFPSAEQVHLALFSALLDLPTDHSVIGARHFRTWHLELFPNLVWTPRLHRDWRTLFPKTDRPGKRHRPDCPQLVRSAPRRKKHKKKTSDFSNLHAG